MRFMKISRYRHSTLWVILPVIVAGVGCEKGQLENDEGEPVEPEPNVPVLKIDSGAFLTMGTFGRIQIRCTDEQAGRRATEAALGVLEEVDQRFSTYREDSELAKVNLLAAKQAVEISPETYQLLLQANQYSRLTEGAFDITVTPLIRLWKQAAEDNRLPTEVEIREIKAKVGFEKLTLNAADPPTVEFAVEGMELNVDAIGKGYAVDRALAALREPGIVAALVDIGGEVAGFGESRPGKYWMIGIQDPQAAKRSHPLSQEPRWLIRLEDCAVATSGNYRQYVRIEGKQYSHIINPRTGRPADILPSVTVIAPTTADADALATAISVMGMEEGIQLIESLANTETLLIAGSRETPILVRSSGFTHFEVTE